MSHTHTVDICIIGAGPVGLFSVFEAGMLGYRCAVVDVLDETGGQLSALYPEKPIYDIPGYPSILAGELIEKLEEQIAPFKPEMFLNEAAVKLDEHEDGSFTLHTPQRQIHCKVVVIASGGGMFSPRKPPLSDIESFEDTSLFYAVRNKAMFDDKTLVIAGGGDSAADWAVELAPKAKHVHVIHRRREFRAAEETVSQMYKLEDAGKITLHTPCQLSDIHGRDGQISAVVAADLEGDTTTIGTDYLLCFYGLVPQLGPLTDWGLEIDKKKVVVDPTTMGTARKGILAVGDICTHAGKLHLILQGFAEAALAMKTAQSVIDPDKKFKVSFSTSTGIQGFES